MPVPPRRKQSYRTKLAKKRHSTAARRAAETPEQTAARREANRKSAAIKRSMLTAEELAALRESRKIYAAKRRAKKRAKAEHVLKDLPNLDIVKQEPFDNESKPFPVSEYYPSSHFLNSIAHYLNMNNTSALGNSLNEWIIPNNPDDIVFSAALSDISESSSTLYTSTNTAESSYKNLKLSMNPSTSNAEIEDGLTVFGEFIATKMRSLTDQNLQVEAQNRITNMLFEMEMKHSPKDSLPVINSISSMNTKSSPTAILSSSIFLNSSNSKNIVAFNAG